MREVTVTYRLQTDAVTTIEISAQMLINEGDDLIRQGREIAQLIDGIKDGIGSEEDEPG